MNQVMEPALPDLRRNLISRILAAQDASFRWGFDEQQTRQHPETLYYSPNFRSTLWTLVLLADLQVPPGIPQISAALELISRQFFDPEHGIFRLPGESHFPIPCLNGNMILLHQTFGSPIPEALQRTVAFFARYQRFDDGDSCPPEAYPYSANRSCYGKHTCYWGVTKLFKGAASIPKKKRTPAAQQLIGKCIEYILQHEVCFGSHHPERLLHKDIGLLTFPNFYKSDLLEILWLLKKEGVQDPRTARALALLKSKQQADGTWNLEKPVRTIVPVGLPGCANAFITERARQVLEEQPPAESL